MRGELWKIRWKDCIDNGELPGIGEASAKLFAEEGATDYCCWQECRKGK